MNETTPSNYECEDISTLNEINLLRCKLETKSQVLKSISKELIVCRKEKDEFKLMAEQLGEKCSLMKRRIERLNSLKGQSEDEMNFGSLDDYNTLVLNQNYKKLQDSNKLLNFEINDLRIKLTDAESDIRLLREKIGKLKKPSPNYSDNIIDNINGLSTSGKQNQTQQHLIQEIEKMKMKNKELEKDLKLHLDEKEDLIKSRNSYILKADRLNESLNALMKGEESVKNNLTNLDKNASLPNTKKSTSDLMDIDSILSENNFLKEKLKCLEQDKKFSQEMITKYKQALDKNNSSKKNFFEPLSSLTQKRSNKPGDSLNYLNQDIVSTREMQSFIASNNLDNLELTEATLLKLRKIVLMLYESVSDKSAALNLAKTNNKLLGKRINVLEAKLREYENRERDLRVETFKMKLDESRRDEGGEDDKSNRDKDEQLEKEQLDNEKYEEPKLTSKLSLEHSDAPNEDINRNIIDTKHPNDEDLINLPNNLQKLVEEELEKLKNDV